MITIDLWVWIPIIVTGGCLAVAGLPWFFGDARGAPLYVYLGVITAFFWLICAIAYLLCWIFFH